MKPAFIFPTGLALLLCAACSGPAPVPGDKQCILPQRQIETTTDLLSGRQI